VLPSGQTATVAQVLDTPPPGDVAAGHSAGIVLDREVDVSRGDWLLAPGPRTPSRESAATIAWLDDEPLVAGRAYWALHGHRWVKAKVKRIVHKLDVNTLAEEDATSWSRTPSATSNWRCRSRWPPCLTPVRAPWALVLVDTASHKTSGPCWSVEGRAAPAVAGCGAGRPCPETK
jgi:sulfate adenylyltransferase subunit 1